MSFPPQLYRVTEDELRRRPPQIVMLTGTSSQGGGGASNANVRLQPFPSDSVALINSCVLRISGTNGALASRPSNLRVQAFRQSTPTAADVFTLLEMRAVTSNLSSGVHFPNIHRHQASATVSAFDIPASNSFNLSFTLTNDLRGVYVPFNYTVQAWLGFSAPVTWTAFNIEVQAILMPRGGLL